MSPNLPPLGIPGLDRAVAALEASGHTVRFDIWRLHYVVVKIDDSGWRHDGLTTFDLINMANELEPQTERGQ